MEVPTITIHTFIVYLVLIDQLRDELDIITGKRRQEGIILVFVIFFTYTGTSHSIAQPMGGK